MNAHYSAEKVYCLISFDPEPLSIHFTYGALILVLMRFMLGKHALVAHGLDVVCCGSKLRAPDGCNVKQHIILQVRDTLHFSLFLFDL